MKHIHFIGITVVFTAILLGAVLFGRQPDPRSAKSSDAEEIELLQQILLLQSASFNRLQIHSEVDSVADVDGKRFLLKDIYAQRRLTFRFLEGNCDVCIETELQFLRRLGSSIGNHNIVVLASYARHRDFRIMSQTYKTGFQTYNVPSDLISSPLEGANRPYLFVADSSLIAGYLFIPAKELPQISEAYYQMVTKLWNVQTERNNVAQMNMKPTTLRIDKSSYRFGSLRTGDEATATFTITNTGKSPLLLQEVQATCGCTVPEWTRSPISPDQTATIKLKYDTNIKGVFSKKAFIFSNAEGSPHGITVSGEVTGR